MASINTTWIVRPEDLVVLKFDFTNLVLDVEKRALNKHDPQVQAKIIVTFQPQHIAEEVNNGNNVRIFGIPTPSRISGLTRLVFTEPDKSTFTPFPYTLRGVLELCTRWKLKVSNKVIRLEELQMLQRLEDIVGPFGPPTFPITFRQPIVETPITFRPPILEQPITFRPRLPITFRPPIFPRPPILEPIFPRLPILEPIFPPDILNMFEGLPEEPTPDDTSIELPYRLLLSPSSNARWVHTVEPYTENGITESWYTTLEETENLYALYTRDKDFSGWGLLNGTFSEEDANAPFIGPHGSLGSLTADKRGRIVNNTTNTSREYTQEGYKPLPAKVDYLSLSSLGGTMKVRGDWPESDPGLVAWRHRTALGRDEEVLVTEVGNLAPFGHRALLTRITRRTIYPNGKAELESFHRVVVTEVKRTYSNGPDNARLRRKNPFRDVEYKQLSSADIPNLDDRGNIVYVPQELPVVATDCQGNRISMQVPIVFIKGGTNLVQPNDVTLLLNERMAFDTSSTYFTQDMTLNIGRVSHGIVPEMLHARLFVDAFMNLTTTEQYSDPMVFSYNSIYLDNGFDNITNRGEHILDLSDPAFSPKIDFSQGADKSGGFLQPSTVMRGLSRKLGVVSSNGTETFTPSNLLRDFKLFGILPIADLLPIGDITQAPSFITKSLNKIERLVHDLQNLQSRLGDVNENGVAAINTINQLLPAITNLDATSVTNYITSLMQNLQQVAAYIDSNIAANGKIKLLRLQIVQFLQTVQNVRDIVNTLESGADLVKDMHIHLAWQQKLSLSPASPEIIKKVFAPGNNNSLLLSVDVRTKTHQNVSAGVEVFCSLDDFTLMLLNSTQNINITDFSSIPVTLHFKHMQFTSGPQKKPDISVVLGDLRFGGALAFIETLRHLIPLDGFSDPPNLQVDYRGITAGFSLALPNIAIGVFSLENISFSAGLMVPFIGNYILGFDFAFCTPEHPFLLTVAMLGGGGYFHIRLSPEGIDALEAALEFGASLSINLGVASGSVCIMAGIYFAKKDKDVSLSGYFRIRGEVDVLGLISASIEMRMSLTWVISTKEVVGQATIIVEVDILFFSESVKISAERRFAGSNQDPTFEEIMAPEGAYDPWSEYCLAYA